MTKYEWILIVVTGMVFLFVIGPIAMNMWGAMFAKGFFQNWTKYINKRKFNTDEHKEDK